MTSRCRNAKDKDHFRQFLCTLVFIHDLGGLHVCGLTVSVNKTVIKISCIFHHEHAWFGHLTPIARSPAEEFSGSGVVDRVFPAALGLFTLRWIFALFRHAEMLGAADEKEAVWFDLVWGGWNHWADALMKEWRSSGLWPLQMCCNAPDSKLVQQSGPTAARYVMLWGMERRGRCFAHA